MPGKVPRSNWIKDGYPVLLLSRPQHYRPNFHSPKKFEKFCNCDKMSTHALTTSRKHKTGFLVKNFGECCGSTVWTAACYWPSSHCIPAHKFVSVSGGINLNRWLWVLVRSSEMTGMPRKDCRVLKERYPHAQAADPDLWSRTFGTEGVLL